MKPIKRFTIGNTVCGGKDLFLIAGPCVLEDEHTVLKTAEGLAEIAERMSLGIIFKSSFLKDNRSRSENYRGPGIDAGLTLLDGVRARTGLPIITDIHESGQASTVAEVVDVLQIPAYLCMQSSLLESAARTGLPVNLKHGQFLAPGNIALPLSKLQSAGAEKILITERGYSFGYDDLIVDPRAFYELGRTGYPVVFDVTHSIRRYGVPSADPAGGRREYINVLARAAAGAGINGLFIETHTNPAAALCDAASQMALPDLEEFLKPLLDIHAVTSRWP